MKLVLDTLKWSAAIGAAVLALTLLKPLLDKRYSPKWRCWSWLALAALLLLAPLQWEAFLPRPAPPPVVIEVPRIELAVSMEKGVSFQQPGSAPRPDAGLPAETLALDQVLTSLWLGGAALFILYHLLGTWFFCHRLRRWSGNAGVETLALYESVCREMGLKRAPRLCVSARAASPMLAGLFRPCLILPAADFSNRELGFILRHELTHYRRRDLWYKLALLLANAVHWFNPLVYLMRREASADLELTCDAAVVAGADAETRRAYSETLLASVHRQHAAALSTHFYGGARVMKERFRNILGKRGRRWGVLALALTLLATVAAACAVGLNQPSEEQDQESPQDTSDTGPDAGTGGVTFTLQGLSLEVSSVISTRQETVVDDGGTGHTCDVFVCNPGAEISVLDAGMDSEGGHPEWAIDTASGRVNIVDNMAPVAVTEDVYGVYDPESSLYVLRFEMADTSTEAAVPLTREELAYFENYFQDSAQNGLLRFPYEGFAGVRPYLELLFYDAGAPVTSEEEHAALEEWMGTPIEVDCSRLTRTYLQEFLTWNFAGDIGEAALGWMLEGVALPYLEEYDAWYLVHGDTMIKDYEFFHGYWRPDGTVELYYITDLYEYEDDGELNIRWDENMCATLRLIGNDVWGMVSNKPGVVYGE